MKKMKASEASQFNLTAYLNKANGNGGAVIESGMVEFRVNASGKVLANVGVAEDAAIMLGASETRAVLRSLTPAEIKEVGEQLGSGIRSSTLLPESAAPMIAAHVKARTLARKAKVRK